jgi:hypothetical protein
MDETDTPVTGPEAIAAEAARQWAEQRRASARAQFTTPTWLGPTRPGAETPAVPAQAEPEHDDLDVVIPSAAVRRNIPDAATWAEQVRPRVFAGTVLTLALLGTVGFLVDAVITQSVGAVVGTVACAFVAVLFRGALMGAALTMVELKGSVMRVRKGSKLTIVNLADPAHFVELVGTPGQSTWRVRILAVDGSTVELGPKEVDPVEVHNIVEYYREIANRERYERERRFNR